MIKEFFQRIGNKRIKPVNIPIETETIEKILGYNFQDQILLVQAFKHRSYLILNNENSHQSNERLEFLGDAVLDLIVTEHLYQNYPEEAEGILSKKKSVLVSRQVLGGITEQLGLGAFLLVNKGEEKTGGRNRLSNLANLFEAILGSIYLDGGLENATEFVNKFLINRKNEFLAKATYFNYKSTLLEYSQAKGWGIPVYETAQETGPDHNKQFEVVVTVHKRWSAKGRGKSKKKAEQHAAKNVLKKIKAAKSVINKAEVDVEVIP
jgi:ribonuclease-3